MTDGATPQQRLSKAVRERRTQLGLSVREASKRSGISRNTWQSLEEGTRLTQDRHYGGIERALRWPNGHILALLENEQPDTAEPTNEQIIAMKSREIMTHYVQLDNEFGKAAADDWLFHAASIRYHARRATQGTVAEGTANA